MTLVLGPSSRRRARISRWEPGVAVAVQAMTRWTQPIDERADAQVVRAKVVAPLHDAVRLVDREERQLDVADELGEAFEGEALGRGVDDLVLARAQAAQTAFALVAIERRREERRRDAARGQTAHLILHQRDERRDDDRGAGKDDRRQLVAERFAAAGRRDEQHPARPLEQRIDGLSLPDVKRGQTKALFEHLLEIEGGRIRSGEHVGGARYHRSGSGALRAPYQRICRVIPQGRPGGPGAKIGGRQADT